MKTCLKHSHKTVTPSNRATLPALVAAALLSSLAAQPQSLSPVYTGTWSLNQGSRYDLPASAANTERGIAWNPATGNVLMASRTTSNHVSVIDGTTGAETITSADIKNAICRAVAILPTNNTSDRTYSYTGISAKQVFGGVLPSKFVLFTTTTQASI